MPKKKRRGRKVSTKNNTRLPGTEILQFISFTDDLQRPTENSQVVKPREVLQEENLENNKQDPVQKLRRPISKSPRLRDRKKIKNIDAILMSELLIKPISTAGGNNNNDTDLSNQNNNLSCSNEPNETEMTHDGEDATRVQNNSIEEISSTESDTNLSRDSLIEEEQYDDDDTNLSKKRRYQLRKNLHKNKIPKQKIVGKKRKPDPPNTHFECDDCKKTFRFKKSLIRHVLVHLNLKPYSCSHCPDKKFRQYGNMRVHVALLHPENYKKEKFSCRKCKKCFEFHEQLELHQETHLKRFICVFCDKAFLTKLLLTQHEEQHMVPGRYKCTMCKMSYDARHLYTNHIKSHAQKEKKFACQYCGKKYSKPSYITNHIRTNHGGMRIECPICKKLLKGHLSEHLRTHEQHRPHQCDVCGLKFTQSTQLTVHKRGHTGDKPYLCRICDQRFSHSSHLSLHIRRHTGVKPFECLVCSLKFTQMPHMKTHMRRFHNKTECFKCNHCNKLFKFKALLKAHSEQCGNADESEKQKDSLISRLRFLVALYFSMITSKEKLSDLGFNTRPIDDILVDSVKDLGMQPCKDTSLCTLTRLRINVQKLLQGTVPKHQMALFVEETKTTEELLEMLTDEKNKRKIVLKRC